MQLGVSQHLRPTRTDDAQLATTCEKPDETGSIFCHYGFDFGLLAALDAVVANF